MRGLYLVSVWIHILAAMTWVGGMMLFVAAVMPTLRQQADADRKKFLDDFGPRFRTVAWACLVILALTGAINLWMRGVRPLDFLRPEWRSSSFGHLVILKLSFVLFAVAASVLHERAVAGWQARWLGRLSLLLGLTIVAVAVVLVRSL